VEDFTITKIEDIIVVKIELLIATLRDAKPFWDELENNLIFNWKKIILDVSSCHSIDSTFIGMIVKVFKEVSARNGKLKLVFPQRESAYALRYLGITKIVECYNSLQEALNDFGSAIPEEKLTFEEKFSLN